MWFSLSQWFVIKKHQYQTGKYIKLTYTKAIRTAQNKMVTNSNEYVSVRRVHLLNRSSIL